MRTHCHIPSNLLPLLLVLAVSPTKAPATTFTVSLDGSTSYTRIQDAISSSTHGDEIVVMPGIYVENVLFNGKNIILRSSDPDDWDTITRTVINGNNSGPVVELEGTEGTTCVLAGLTLTSGTGRLYSITTDPYGNTHYSYYGGGILGNHSQASILNNRIVNNHVLRGGAATALLPVGENYGWTTHVTAGGGMTFCHGLIQGNLIGGNSADIAGGVLLCYGDIRQNLILKNSAATGGGATGTMGMVSRNCFLLNRGGKGGGIYASFGTVSGNLICGNGANKGGGAYTSTQAIFVNNTVWANSARNANGTGEGGGVYILSDDPIRNCIVWGNVADGSPQVFTWEPLPTYSCIQDWPWGGEGNISSDPQFVDPANGDFRLRPDSPCIDTGGFVDGVTDDYYGNPRPVDGDGLSTGTTGDGSDYDMGAYEFGPTPGAIAGYLSGQTTPSAPQKTSFDLNTDGKVDIVDMIIAVASQNGRPPVWLPALDEIDFSQFPPPGGRVPVQVEGGGR